MIKRLARAALNLTLLATTFCLAMLLLSYVLHRIYTAQNPLPAIILAPQDTPVIPSPQELNEEMKQELAGKIFVSKNKLISVSTGQIVGRSVNLPSALPFHDFSIDGRYMVYMRGGGIGYDRSELVDLLTGEKRLLLEQQDEFPKSVGFGAVALAPDNQSMVFALFLQESKDFVRFDFATNTWKRLNVDVIYGGFGDADISPEGQILTRCAERVNNRIVYELRLLDENGKFIRYLTDENYVWHGYGKYTLSGEWIVYENRSRLYKIRKDGSGRQEIAPCAPPAEGPAIVTDHYAVVWCGVSREPDCGAYFLASLDGKGFWRLGYIDTVCTDDSKATLTPHP